MPASPRPGERPAAPVVALVVGLVYATAEYFRQIALPSPSGVPGDSGAHFPELLALAICAIAGPAVLVSLLFRRRRGAGPCAIGAAAWVVGSAVVWRALDRAGQLSAPDAPGPLLFLLPGLLVAVVAGVVGIPVLRRWPARVRLPLAIPAGIVVVAGFVLAWGLRVPAPDPGEPGDGPNVLLVTIDTLRRDALGSYGGSPGALDSLGAVAHAGWSVSSWTQPAMASLFSGVVPTGHGSDPHHGPDPAVQWWPEELGRAQSAAFVTNPYLRRRFGFNRGFTTFDHVEERPWMEPVARTVLAEWWTAVLNTRETMDRADTVVGRARDWLEGTQPDRPWFLWVHLLDPHLPYTLRGEGGRPAPERVPDWAAPLSAHIGGRGFEDLRGARAGEVIVTDAERAALRQLYQTGVDYAAWWTRELIEAAGRASEGRELVWLVTSDHGEEFFDEGGFEHGHALNEAVLAVPMLTSGLGDEPQGVRLTDLGPWILDAVGVPVEFDPKAGAQLLEDDAPLLPLALGATPHVQVCDPPPMLAEGLLYGPARTLMVQQDGSRWLRHDGAGPAVLVDQCAPGEAIREDGQWELLDFWRDRRTRSPLGITIDDDLRRQLRALGYTH